MQVSLFSFVDLYSKGLQTLTHLLTEGSEYAEANGFSEDQMLEWQLAEDMFPLRRQAHIVCDFAVQWPARAAGLTVPDLVAGASSVSELVDSARRCQAYLAQLTPDQFAGRDQVLHTQNLGSVEPTMPLGQWLTGFATTNFYFHLSVAYAILRAKGVPLTKPDLFAGGL